MNVSLTPEIEKIVAEKIASGEYPSASEVFRQALELLEERERLIKLRRDVSLGVEQLDQGRSKRFDIRTLSESGAQLASGLPPAARPNHPCSGPGKASIGTPVPAAVASLKATVDFTPASTRGETGESSLALSWNAPAADSGSP